MIPYCILAIENEDDREFMSSLYIDYKRLMYSEIRKIIKDDRDAEDIMQDVLEKLIDKIPLLRSRNRNQRINYIISACKFTSFNYIRDNSSKKELSFEDFLGLPDSDYDGHEIELRIIKEEELETLRRVLPQMDSRTRCLLEGYHFLDKTVEELGTELSVKPDSVRMMLTRAKKKIFEVLRKELDVKITEAP